jgi:F-type H+-transporting ATPase subunit delta
VPGRPSTAARRFAEAAFELAERDNALDAWAAGLASAAATVADRKVADYLDNPAVPLKDRQAALDGLLGRAPDGVVRLAKLLAVRRSTDRLSSISAEFQRLLNKRRGVVDALVTSAAPLTHDETDALAKKVARMTNREVQLRVEVDEALIGGLTVRIGDTLYDASVRGRLERLREQLVTAAR